MYNATIEEALNHPTWTMGRKVTIDSASLMNKGLELIEAHWLYGAPAEQLDAIMHPQSIVHSFVEFRDGSVVAQLAQPDMRLPIQYAITWPKRLEGCIIAPLLPGSQDLGIRGDRLRSIPRNTPRPRRPSTPVQRLERSSMPPTRLPSRHSLLEQYPLDEFSEIVEETGVEMKLRPADSFPAILAADQEAREIAHARIGVASKP